MRGAAAASGRCLATGKLYAPDRLRATGGHDGGRGRAPTQTVRARRWPAGPVQRLLDGKAANVLRGRTRWFQVGNGKLCYYEHDNFLRHLKISLRIF